MGPAFEALFWGFVSGGALVLGAAIGYLCNVPSRVIASVMAFGSGVLISALSFELMEEAYQQAGLAASATGFLLGAAIYAAANRVLAIWGAKSVIGALYDDEATWREKAEHVTGCALPCGHAIPEEAPQALVEALLAFLSDA